MEGEEVSNPTTADILLGRTSEALNHRGNYQYRDLINKRKEEYVTCSRADKGRVAKEIVDKIQSISGRFLKQDKGAWYVISDKAAVEKTKQALREGQDKLKQKLTKEGKLAPKAEISLPPLRPPMTDLERNGSGASSASEMMSGLLPAQQPFNDRDADIAARMYLDNYTGELTEQDRQAFLTQQRFLAAQNQPLQQQFPQQPQQQQPQQYQQQQQQPQQQQHQHPQPQQHQHQLQAQPQQVFEYTRKQNRKPSFETAVEGTLPLEMRPRREEVLVESTGLPSMSPRRQDSSMYAPGTATPSLGTLVTMNPVLRTAPHERKNSVERTFERNASQFSNFSAISGPHFNQSFGAMSIDDSVARFGGFDSIVSMSSADPFGEGQNAQVLPSPAQDRRGLLAQMKYKRPDSKSTVGDGMPAIYPVQSSDISDVMSAMDNMSIGSFAVSTTSAPSSRRVERRSIFSQRRPSPTPSHDSVGIGGSVHFRSDSRRSLMSGMTTIADQPDDLTRIFQDMPRRFGSRPPPVSIARSEISALDAWTE